LRSDYIIRTLDLFSVLNPIIIKHKGYTMQDLRYIDDVSTLVLDEKKCIGCSLCTEVCPHAVFEMKENKATIVDFNACMECGACVMNCPSQAIAVSPGVG
jgi:NAD-dependent dihydropyrimidine dehydrogenase PreA subunit